MKRKLEQIYRELSSGILSEDEAMARIRALRRAASDPSSGTVLACAEWEPVERSTGPANVVPEYGRHHVILSDVPHVEARELETLLAPSRCEAMTVDSAGDIAERYTKLALACFESIRSILKSRPSGPVLVQVVIGSSDDAHVFAGLAGLLETAALENPSVAGQILFAPSAITAGRLAQLLRAECSRPLDRVLDYGHDVRRLWRWRLIEEGAPHRPDLFKERGVYLITGGLGGLGVLFAKEIQKRTSDARIILTGRAPLTEAKRARLQTLQRSGHSVEYRQLDVAEPDQVRRLVASITQAHGQLNGIIHSAGVVRDDFILKKSEARFREVLRPKVAGSYNLDAATEALPLDFLLLFSSIASWSGNAGQADYAAANGFMNQFAACRNRLVAAGKRQGRTLALLWPHWLEGGMSTDPASMAALRQRTGMGSLDTESGMQALYRGLASGRSHVLVMHGNVAQMRRALLGEPAIAKVETAPQRAIVRASDDEATRAHRAQSVNGDATISGADAVNDLTGKTREFLRGELAAVLKLPASKVDARAPLEAYGIDSIMAMKLTGRLEETFGALAKTLFFEYLTIEELTGYFVQSHAERLTQLFATPGPAASTERPQHESPPAFRPARRERQRFFAAGRNAQAASPCAASPSASSSSAPSPSAAGSPGNPAGRAPSSASGALPVRGNAPVFHDEPIAVVGLSGRYPESRDLEAFWRNLRDGKDCIVEIPPERWDWRRHYSEDRTRDGAHYSKWGGFIEGVDEFDPRFFNIAPRDAHGIDPQERLFLQHAWMAIEDAGYTRASLRESRGEYLPGQVGVYAGVMYGEYNVSGTLASIANRVSYFLNLHGPSLTLDTMCSSSLTAIHLACQDLRLGRTSLAIAGGVNVSIHPNKYKMLSGGQFISSDGHCRSFGEGGDGYIPGEGVGVAILKRLSDAERDGNHIYGLIRGSALNHGGKTNGYTVPNPQAQAEVIRRALMEANVPARHVSYIEAHGTGTKLGDPIEIAALSKAFHDGARPAAREAGFCRIGSAKSNIGHCESAAGIAGVTKVLLQMKHRQIVPSLHSRKLNPHIDFAATPFVVNQSLTQWEQPEVDGRRRPRIAGVSSFGAGGSNAHVVIEEYAAPVSHSGDRSLPVIVPLSARTAPALQQRARDLLDFIRRNEADIDLHSMAWTLQVGREAMEDRLACLVSSVRELEGKLEAILRGEAPIEGTCHGQVKEHKDALAALTAEPDFQPTLARWIAARDLPRLMDLWVKGLDLDWRALMDGGQPRLMSLPAYPFARERYWIQPSTAAAAPVAQPRAVLHPLLHENTSSLEQLRYTSRFTGSEPFLEQGSKELPALLALEMIRGAAERVSPRRAESGAWELHGTVWGEPIDLTGGCTLETALLAQGSDQIDVEIYSPAADGDGAGDRIHCQSHAIFSRQPAPARVDLARAKEGLRPVSASDERQLLQEVDLAARSDEEKAECSLHPDLLGTVSRLVQRLTGQAFTPASIERVRIVFACPEKIVAWARRSADGSIDIDLCDTQGNVCVQIIGLQIQALPPSAEAEPREIPLTPPAVSAPLSAGAGWSVHPEIARKKPAGIVLTDGAEVGSLPPPAARPSVSLAAAASTTADSLSSTASIGSPSPAAHRAAPAARLFDLTGGVFAIELGEGALADSIESILQAMQRAAQEPDLKVLLLKGPVRRWDDESACWSGDRNACNRAIERGLFETVGRFPYPVIAVPGARATGAGLLLAAACDFMVCSEEGRYGFTDARLGLAPTESEARFFHERLGDAVATGFLRREAPLSGRELKSNGWACRIVPAHEVEASARQLALELAHGSQLALRLLKTHLGRQMLPLLENLAAGSAEAATGEPALSAVATSTTDAFDVLSAATASIADAAGSIDTVGAPAPVPMRSDVVSVSAYPEGVVLVSLHDRQAKNMFSEALVAGLKEAFAHIERTPAYKVVILTGYDSYFATGGTRETLLAIQNGEARFTDEKAFQLPMECPLPVIAAMQGHAIGGGWSFGMFADAALLSEESRYRSPYMRYGFTPGAGSTLVFPKKIGYDLARETLLTGQEVSGAELKRRGLGLPVLPRRRVVPAAVALAHRLARHSREQLVQWKREWTRTLRELRDDTYRRELAMHEQTFVGQADTLAKIQAQFAAPSVETAAAAARPAEPAAAARAMPAVIDKLRELLAQELQLAPEEIDENAQFIDLGLDSLTGVTWIRRINAHYGTAIEATKVYSYPTLTALARYVMGEIGGEIAAAPADDASVPAQTGTTAPAADGVIATLAALLADELHLRPEEIDESAQFIDLGLDSLTGVTWIRRINERYGTSIEATQVYRYPTLRELSRHVQQEAEKAGTLAKAQMPAERLPAPAPTELTGAQLRQRIHTGSGSRGKLVSWRTREPARSQPEAQAPADRSLQPVAVIGMAGQFARSKDPEAFWENLAAGRSCIEVVPDERWSLEAYYREGGPVPGKTNSKWLGALEEYDRFDPLFFNISPTEAESMDPQQRLFLQTCWHSIENAGYDPRSLSGSQCGVFVGCGPGDYLQLSRERQLSAQGFTGAATSILAARIAYFLNLRGPCLSIDTACSSSLVAIATACDSLNGGNSDLALAGGVYVMSGPAMHIMTSQAGMLSPDGRCFAFDQRANGFVPGEGVGVVVLKRLADAERDEDRILGVIEGWGVNQDGRTNGITAPNEESQTRLIEAVYRRFGIDPSGIQLIEAHGTGTKLGDPIEVAGLKAAFKAFTDRRGYCALGSVKSNIGHCLTAAGAAGIIKLLLALKHRQLPPTIHFQQCNEHIRLEGSPFYINDSLKPWSVAAHERRRAAISSFGFSGTNAHIVIAEHAPPAQAAAAAPVVSQDSKIAVCLSARTEAQLRQKAIDLLAFVRRRAAPVRLEDLAYTLHVGREQMSERLGLLAGSLEELTGKLEAYVAGEPRIEDLYRGEARRHKEAMQLISQDGEMRAMIVGKWLSERKLSKLLDLWVKGVDLDWTVLYGSPKPRRMELPGYPFAKDRFWIEAPSPAGAAGTAGEVIHPLVHRNASLLSRQRYCSVFTGQEDFLERGADGAKIVPESSLLEMARVAVRHATSDLGPQLEVSLADIAWEEPLVINAPTEVFVELFQLEDDGVAFEIRSAEAVHVHGTAHLGEPSAAQPEVVPSARSAEPDRATTAESWDGLSYLYGWDEQPRAVQPPPAAVHKSALIVCCGSTRELEATIRAHYEQGGAGQVTLIRVADRTQQVSANEWLCGADDAEGFQTCLQGLRKIDALYFLAMPESGSEAASAEESVRELARRQQATEVQLLRVVKCLKADNRLDGKVDTYLLTLDNHAPDRGATGCGGAGVAGLGYALAQGNYQFRVRNLDVSSRDLRSAADRSSLLAAVLSESASDRGEVVKLHAGKRYRRTFFKLGWPARLPSGIRHNGVYLILGGSGVVGRAITRNLIEKYQANVVWLGRSAETSERIREALRSCAASGDRLLYVQADVLDPDSMRRAVGLVKAKFGRIHGAVFSGMVFGIDNSIEHIPEADFRAVLDIKTLGSLAFYDALKNEPLDFMCYFSSGQAYSFSGAAKVCGYAAGITFTDSFVRSIQSTSAFAVGTINWGAWESFVRERLSRMDGVSTKNMGAFEDREGFACFERFVSALQQGSIHQVLCMRASPEVQSLMSCDSDTLAVLAGSGSCATISLDDAVPIPREKIAHLKALKESSRLDDWFVRLLFHHVSRLVESAGVAIPATVAELCKRCGILDKYVAWMDSTLELFAGKGYVEVQDGVIRKWHADTSRSVWNEWQVEKRKYAEDPDTKPLTALVDECLERLADILHGAVAATDVIFPGSSMEKVGPLYNGNATADTFNEIVANAVLAYLERRLQLDPRARLRILEIGAGTGGTSAAVFAALKPHKQSVEEYCYTDLSKAFFFHAEKHYLPDNPYIVCRRLDIEKPIESQGIEVGRYDLVIATNVLHATRNIRRTLRNCKAALRADGFILLNEMSCKSLSTHLTFAMLDGWWLFQDPDLRIPGCPGLYPEGWQRALEEEGFRDVRFPAREGHVLGNQIVLARSDGVIRQPLLARSDGVARQPVTAAPAAAAEERRPSKAAPREAVQRGSELREPVSRELASREAAPRAPALPAAPKAARDIGQLVRQAILGCLSGTLKIAPESIDVDTAFADYGIDSILGVSFVDQLNARLSIALNTAVIFEYSSVERLTRHVLEAHKEQVEALWQEQAPPGSSGAVEAARATRPAAQEAPANAGASTRRRLPAAGRSRSRGASVERTSGATEIAVIGMSGKFPKAGSVHEFWRNLVDGVDGVEELPEHYLDKRFFSPRKQKGKTRCKWGGILAERDCFDPLFFNLSPREALSMNPHQRLVMQESWNALEDAGIDPKTLSGTRTGVFVGSEPTGYAGETFTGVSDAIIASRLSYVLNLRGPAFVVNTGCSASGVALHLACESLRNRESDLALAGGVNACMTQSTQIGLDEIDMLSPSGRCFTFDKAGDGTIISEGVAMVALKRLDDAIAAGDPIYGTIVASGINQDGASNGITAPNGESQEQLIRSVYDRFGIDPERIGYVEAHGTGTKLGDPVETNALIRAFRKYTDKQGYCAIGSAKSHIGHAAAAAGAIGLIKVLLTLRHRTFPKLLNFRELNPLIELAGSPFFVTTERSEWKSPAGVPRMAALNSFGHSGTNVHIVVKEYLRESERGQPVPHPCGDRVVPLSAKTREQLRQRCADLLSAIRAAPEAIDFRSLAYTLQTGREAMEERLAVVASSTGQLAEKLHAYLEGGRSVAGLYEGRAKRNGEAASLTGDESAAEVAELWATGRKVSWSSLWSAEARPDRMSLPGYPFAKERYWIEAARSVEACASGSAEIEDGESIEDIINRIADESLEAHEGVKRLRRIV